MGVKGLHSFIQKRVPNGTFPIDIREEINKYYNNSTDPNPPPPIIVVDLKCLVYPFLRLDPAGVICGGRFNDITRRMDRFFADLTSAGVKLEFFSDGPKRNASTVAWCERKDGYYREMQKLCDAVDNGEEISVMERFGTLPFHYVFTLKQSAVKHGKFHWAVARKCDQEMAAFANESKALAIMTDDSDFLIHDGSYRFWCTNNLNISNLTLTEYDRVELVRFLGLNQLQMPLLATLTGNDLVDSRALSRLHSSLGQRPDNIANIAKFIRDQSNQPVNAVLNRALESCRDTRMLMDRFNESLESYKMNYQPINQQYAHDPIEALLLSRQIPLFYQLWNLKHIECSPGVIDLRQDQLGKQVAQLKVSLILRMGGVTLYHRQMQRQIGDYSKCKIMIKLDHDAPHDIHQRLIAFPAHVQPPPLDQLLSNDPELSMDLLDIKHKLLGWIVSDNLDHNQISPIPESLQITVLTLYCLLENRILHLFEADLLLRVAFDVTFDKYDPESVIYPRTIASRPFRVAFVFTQIYALVARAFNLLGLINSTDKENSPFDGVLFHNRYDNWKRRQITDDGTELDDIKEMRIYSSIAAAKEETED